MSRRVFAAPRFVGFVASAVAFVLAPCAAHAGEAPSAESAEALFESGLADMLARDYDTGCPKLEASYRKEPLPGALFTLAECEAAWGKHERALRRYQAFVTLLPSLPAERRAAFDERRDVALQKIAQLGAVVAELIVDVSPDAPPDLVIRIEGEVMEKAEYGTKMKRDPGLYAIVAEHRGKLVFERRVMLVKRERQRVVVPWTVATARAPVPKPEPSEAQAADGETQVPVASYVAGAVGLGGLLVGTVAGVVALSNKSSVDENCPGLVCNPEGRRALDSARSAAGVSTAGFVVAGVGGASALVMWLLAPASSPTQSARLRPRIVVFDGIGVVLEGRIE